MTFGISLPAVDADTMFVVALNRYIPVHGSEGLLLSMPAHWLHALKRMLKPRWKMWK